jgi:hypothetical protein
MAAAAAANPLEGAAACSRWRLVDGGAQAVDGECHKTLAHKFSEAGSVGGLLMFNDL